MTQASSPTPSSSFSTAPGLAQLLGGELAAIDRAGLRRALRRIESAQEPVVEIDGREVLLFCSNNYLGLANHPEVVAAAVSATERYGASAVSSRLISGHMSAHADLEDRLAAWKRTEAALVFSTGYQANLGTITSLVGRGDVVVSDELNHASLIDGARLSRADITVFRHNDTAHLEEILRDLDNRGASPTALAGSSDTGAARRPRVLVVTESVFSMDGDHAPLADIARLTERYGAWLMVDEAHAAGVFGPAGAGLVAELGLTDRVDVHVGTLGKALGSFGAYVAGSRVLIDLLINRARAFIFTTGLPPATAAAAQAALEVVAREPERAAGLLRRARDLGAELGAAGLRVPHMESQILPILVGEASDTVAAAEALLARGIYVAAIRPPTVPAGTSRLRLSLMATHTDEQIARTVAAIRECVPGATTVR